MTWVRRAAGLELTSLSRRFVQPSRTASRVVYFAHRDGAAAFTIFLGIHPAGTGDRAFYPATPGYLLAVDHPLPRTDWGTRLHLRRSAAGRRTAEAFLQSFP